MERRIGTSGYAYPEWKGGFYPPGEPASRWFGLYAARFDTVELNHPFYRFPTEAAVRGWRERAPRGFLYAVKAWQGITHHRKLARCGRELEQLLERLDGLRPFLGPVLFQLPPQFRADPARLREFLRLLPSGFRFAMEFRHASWFDERVYGALRERGVAACRASSPAFDGPADLFTADFGYWRLHGRREWYRGSYGEEGVRAIADEIRGAGRDAYAYFDNTADAAAPEDARRLQGLLAEPTLRCPRPTSGF